MITHSPALIVYRSATKVMLEPDEVAVGGRSVTVGDGLGLVGARVGARVGALVGAAVGIWVALGIGVEEGAGVRLGARVGIGVLVEAAIGVDVPVGTGAFVEVAAGVAVCVIGAPNVLDLPLLIKTMIKGTEIRPITKTSIAINTHSTVGTLGGAAGAGAGRYVAGGLGVVGNRAMGAGGPPAPA